MDRAERKNAIGFALSGGGLQGIAHIGAIKALYELGIRPQFVSGTSSGAAMAAICAMGMTPEEMRYFAKKHWKTLAEIDSGLIFKALATFIINKKVDKDGIKDGQLIADVVKEGMLLKGVRGFRDLPINLSICTVDTLTTDECIFLTENEHLQNDHIHYLTDVPLDVYSIDGTRKSQKLADLAIEIKNENTQLFAIDSVDETIQEGYDTIMAHKDEILKIFGPDAG